VIIGVCSCLACPPLRSMEHAMTVSAHHDTFLALATKTLHRVLYAGPNRVAFGMGVRMVEVHTLGRELLVAVLARCLALLTEPLALRLVPCRRASTILRIFSNALRVMPTTELPPAAVNGPPGFLTEMACKCAL